jgi:hypothetical protein
MRKRNERALVLACLGLAGMALLMLGGGTVTNAIVKARAAANNQQSLDNAKKMMLGLNNSASCTATGDIAPAWGEIHPGGVNKSFFHHLLPFVEQQDLFSEPQDAPVPTYIAPMDPRNPGTNATISYAANGFVLGVAPSTPPRFPASFCGRNSSTILVMERSGLDGAHKWNASTNTTTLGGPDGLPPFPQFGARPAAYQDGSPQAFMKAGCVVGFADASARNITDKMGDAWKWACNPQDTAPYPAGW